MLLHETKLHNQRTIIEIIPQLTQIYSHTPTTITSYNTIDIEQQRGLPHNHRKRTLNIKYVVIKHFYKSMKHILYPFLHIHRIFATENQRRTAITTQASAYCFKSSTLKEKTLPTAFTT